MLSLINTWLRWQRFMNTIKYKSARNKKQFLIRKKWYLPRILIFPALSKRNSVSSTALQEVLSLGTTFFKVLMKVAGYGTLQRLPKLCDSCLLFRHQTFSGTSLSLPHIRPSKGHPTFSGHLPSYPQIAKQVARNWHSRITDDYLPLLDA